MSDPVGRIRRVTERMATGSPGEVALDIDPAIAVSPTPAHQVVLGRLGTIGPDGRRDIEVVVDGWRFDLSVEDGARAALRDRASRDRTAVGSDGGPSEIRAIIPGRVAAVTVAVGDTVAKGESVLVVEAMKMQNELRAPRDGIVARVLVGAGQTIEIGDLLVVLS